MGVLLAFLGGPGARRCRVAARRRLGVGTRGWGGDGRRGLQNINATIGFNPSQAVLQGPASTGPLRQHRMAVTPAAVNAFLVLAAGDPHQTALIATVVLQGSMDAALEEGSRGAASRLEAGGGADQPIAGHLAGIIKLDQLREALLERAGQGIGQGEGLWNHPIAAGAGGRSAPERSGGVQTP